MLTILAITFPIYAVIALGYLTVRYGVFRREDMPVFGGYVLNIALPALLFNAVATRNLSDLFNMTYMAVFLIGTLAAVKASEASRNRSKIDMLLVFFSISGDAKESVSLRFTYRDISHISIKKNRWR